MSESRRGVLMGVAAYSSWGFLPLYWRLFRGVSPFEILAHRIVWSLVFVGFLVSRAGDLRKVREVGAKRLGLLAAAALFVAANWTLYIWAVNAGHVVETALGYFINPLLTVLLGVVVLREPLRRAQWIALGLVGVAVAILTIDYGRLPWIALVLATTFAVYGFLKKKVGVPAALGLGIETAILVLPAIGYLVVLGAGGAGSFGHSWKVSLLLLTTGLVTATPLLFFAGAANRIPLSVMGPLQYISPTLQFLCGVVVFHEAMPPSRWIGFSLVWFALGLFVVEGAVRQRRVALVASRQSL